MQRSQRMYLSRESLNSSLSDGKNSYGSEEPTCKGSVTEKQNSSQKFQNEDVSFVTPFTDQQQTQQQEEEESGFLNALWSYIPSITTTATIIATDNNDSNGSSREKDSHHWRDCNTPQPKEHPETKQETWTDVFSTVKKVSEPKNVDENATSDADTEEDLA